MPSCSAEYFINDGSIYQIRFIYKDYIQSNFYISFTFLRFFWKWKSWYRILEWLLWKSSVHKCGLHGFINGSITDKWKRGSSGGTDIFVECQTTDCLRLRIKFDLWEGNEEEGQTRHGQSNSTRNRKKMNRLEASKNNGQKQKAVERNMQSQTFNSSLKSENWKV